MNDMTPDQYVTAFFDSEADAEAAVSRIVAEGVPRDRIRVIAGDGDTTAAEPRETGFFASLAELFLPAEDRDSYAEGLSRGGYLVSLTTTPENRERVLDILDDEGTVDMDAREAGWRAEGWEGYRAAEGSIPAGASGAGIPAADRSGGDMIKVLKENLRVGKREVEQGRVRVRSYVVEAPAEEQVSLRDETVRLERRPVDRPAGAEDAFVDSEIEAVETAEEAVVSKEARVTEEISLDTVADTHVETVRDTVRHTEVEVEDARDPRVK